ncbi:MAG: Gfo/Idh/MocA family oxidoreductase [Armatimonadota bacterium]|nr:Gfo/Idh/MocA family oxidoreductase [Armatimonadota bacterium]
MAATKLRAVVVGSKWGRNHALAYHQHPDAELVAVVGRTPDGLSRRLADELQVPLYLDLSRALEELRPDILSCAAREADHEAVTLAGLNAGCHVYCEKLLADTLAAARRMVEAADRCGRQLMVGYNYRFSPSALHLRRLITEGRLGTIACANAFTFSYCLHHTLDLVCSLLGQVDEVYCVLNTDVGNEPLVMRTEWYDEFIYSASRSRTCVLKFEGGAVAVLQSSDYQRVGHPAVRVDVVGSKARANMDDIVGRVFLFTENRTAEVFLPSLILDRLDLPSTTQAAVSAFVDAVRDGKPVPVPGKDGLNRLLIEAALLRSARENRPVSVRGE